MRLNLNQSNVHVCSVFGYAERCWWPQCGNNDDDDNIRTSLVRATHLVHAVIKQRRQLGSVAPTYDCNAIHLSVRRTAISTSHSSSTSTIVSTFPHLFKHLFGFAWPAWRRRLLGGNYRQQRGQVAPKSNTMIFNLCTQPP